MTRVPRPDRTTGSPISRRPSQVMSFARIAAAVSLVIGAMALGTPWTAAPAASGVSGAASSTSTAAPTVAARWLVAFPAALEADLREQGAEIWERDGVIVLGPADDALLGLLAAKGLEPAFRTPDGGEWIYLLSHRDGFAAPPVPDGATVHPITSDTDLYLFARGAEVELPPVKPFAAFRAVPRTPLPPLEPHASDKELVSGAAPAAPLTVNPLVTQIVNGTSQANWYQYEKDVSGENPVVIGGTTYTIRTRYSGAMFPTPAANAMATEYLLDKAAGWGYTGVREPYTSTDSGCSQTSTWQNVVFTLPGQVDFGQHQQVIYVTHYDSLSQDKLNYAPGADDAMSGGSALIEALRLFKDYGFKNTVKIIFFSGEEQGLCGSVAYTRQHPSADMWRVVNMDQTAYDGDLNRLMDVYNWSLASSPQSVALGDAFVQANSDYGSIIDPAKIVRDTTKMCQTDHCPFWNVGVAAIAVTEDLHNNDICPCFDNTDTSTCHDSLTQVDPNHSPRLLFTPEYSWPSEKAAIATVAALAEPLYACPPSAPAPAITPGNNILHVAWPTAPGVTNYVLEKAATCAGPFTALLSTPGTSYDDGSVANGTSYAYRVRTCPTQTSTCVTASPVAGPSVVYQNGSAVVTADSGDHDNIADNCELVTVSVNLLNDGNAPLTGVKLISVSSPHPGVQLATAIPQGAGSLGVGASAPAQFKFYLGRSGGAASCGESIPFTVTASSDQAPQSTRTFSLSAERDLQSGAFSYGFESDLSGWTVTTGTFTRVAGGAPGSTGFSLHSRNANSICDAILSPLITPTASSAMTMYVNYSIESGSWDRAVVRAINPATGTKTLLVPTLAPYTTTGTNTALCDNLGSIQGWAGSLTAWTQASFNLSAFAGTPIQIEVRFSTDGSVLGTQGFWFDNVQITNATQTTCDAQANLCAALPAEVSPGGDPVPFTLVRNGANLDLRFSEVAGATAYEIYGGTLQSLHGGAYDHVASGGICALTDAPAGDGQVTASVPLVGVRGQQLPPGGRAQRRRRVPLRVLLDGRLDPALAPELSLARSPKSGPPQPPVRLASREAAGRCAAVPVRRAHHPGGY